VTDCAFFFRLVTLTVRIVGPFIILFISCWSVAHPNAKTPSEDANGDDDGT